METKETTVAGAVRTILRAIGNGLVKCIVFTVRFILKFDKKVLKRYFNVETPLYKYWWREHSKCIQRKLDRLHGDYCAKYSKCLTYGNESL